MNKPRFLAFEQLGDTRGQLVVIEQFKEVPFAIKRLFYIYGSDSGVIRGQHANRNSQFVLVNLAGSSKVKTDNGRGETAVFSLDRPHVGVYLPTMIWKDMYDFSPDSILLCIASEVYDATEYIRNYAEYVSEING